LIEVKGVSKSFGRIQAVDNVSFEVRKGEILGFLGPNGAGKTTTMRILTCFIPPTEGTASVAGFDIFKSPLQVKSRVGYLPETPPLYPEMTVFDYLQFVAHIKGLRGSQVDGRVETVIDRCEIADVREQLIDQLSKGYRQRVGLAQALVHDPDVLVLDEPTAGLDPKQIIQTRELIKSLAGDHTIILSTHILPEVSMTCERVVIINGGRVVAEGTPQSLTARYQDTEVLTLTVDGAEEPVRRAIGGLSGVTRVQAKPVDGEVRTYQVEVAAGRDVRADIAREIVQQGLRLLELRQTSMNLEDVYLSVISSEELVEHAHTEDVSQTTATDMEGTNDA
jgi:ABC-2 type transport system ATP-binding protein